MIIRQKNIMLKQKPPKLHWRMCSSKILRIIPNTLSTKFSLSSQKYDFMSFWLLILFVFVFN